MFLGRLNINETISSKIKQALANSSSCEEVKDYLKDIRDNMKATEDKFSKNIKFIVLLYTIFYLKVFYYINEFSLGPIKINDLSPIQIFLPVLIAFKYYELNTLSVIRRHLRIIHKEMSSGINSFYSEQGLEFYLIPSSMFLSNEIILGKENRTNGLGYLLAKVFGYIILILTNLGMLGLEIYALFFIYTNYATTNNLLNVISTRVSITLSIVLIYLGYYTGYKGYELLEKKDRNIFNDV